MKTSLARPHVLRSVAIQWIFCVYYNVSDGSWYMPKLFLKSKKEKKMGRGGQNHPLSAKKDIGK